MSQAAAGAAPRLAAARALAAVLDQGHNLTVALEPVLAELDGGRDRSLARRLAMAVLRDLPALEFRLGRLLEKPLARHARVIHFLLLSALAELAEAREPARAVVHASVAAARLAGQDRLASLVNGVLRSFQRQAGLIEAALPDDAVHRFGYPAWLIERIRADWPGRWPEILEAGNRPPPLWLRVNRRRISRQEFRVRLESAGHVSSTLDGLPEAVRLDEPAAISSLPGYGEGHFSVQDAGAQWAAEFIGIADGQRVLDACAAPGGKAAHLLERADIELTAVDLDPERILKTRRALERLGLNAHLLAADATRPEQWWNGDSFDRILIDAPCTATGVIRRHPDIRWLRRPTDVGANAETQRRLLQALWPLLKPGGILVYATCSILAAENRDQAASFLERTQNARVVEQADWPGIRTEPGFQIPPGEGDMDGFYYLVLGRLRTGS